MPAPPSKNPNTDRGSLSAGGAGKGGFSGPGVSSLNAPARSAPSAATGGKGGVASPKGPAASQAAAKANGTKTSNTKTQTAGRVPGTSAAAAKNTALGKVAQTAKQNAQPSGVVGPGRGFIAGSPSGRNYISSSAPAMMQRMGAVSRGPGVLSGARPEAIARTAAFAESPSGLRVPGLASSLQRAALNNQSLFSMRGATPQQQALLSRIGPSALHVAMTTGLDPRTVLGQAMTESTTGRHPSKVSALARNANNLFGIKGWGTQGDYWDGSTVRMPTKEKLNGQWVTVRDPFRSYATPNQSVLDYGNLIERRYSGAADDPTVTGQLSRIRSGGYATHPSSDYVRMGVRNAARLSPGGVTADGTQIASAAPIPTTPARPTQVASAALGSIPRPVPRPADLRTAIPRPVPRPDNLMTGTIARNPYDTQRTYGVPRARPPGVGPERVMSVETYIDPNTGITRNPYEQRAVAQYGGYGTFNTPAPTAGLSRPAYETDRAGEYSGYGPFSTPDRTGPLSRPAYEGTPRPGYSGYGSPFASLPPAQQEQPRLVSEYSGYGAPMPGTKQIYGRVASADGMVPGWTKDQSRIPPTAPRPTYPAGTYTAPYDVAPRMSPFGNVGQEYHQHTAPPTPSQYRNEMPPAAPHPGTPGSQTAEAPIQDGEGGWFQNLQQKVGEVQEAVVQQFDENKKMVEEIEKKVGPLTPEKVKMWAWFNGLGGGTPSPEPKFGNTMNDNAARNYERMQTAFNTMGGPALAGNSGFGLPGSQPQFTAPQLSELLTRMHAMGATPEEIAIVQAAIEQQSAQV